MNFKEAMTGQRKENKRCLDQVRELEPLFPIAQEYADVVGVTHEYNDGKRYATVTPNWLFKHTLDLNIWLGEKDTIKDLLPVADRMIKDKRLDYTNPLPPAMIDADYISCTFKIAGQKTYHPMFTVYIRADNSQACKRVGTGKYKEIMTYECTDDMNYNREGSNEDNQ